MAVILVRFLSYSGEKDGKRQLYVSSFVNEIPNFMSTSFFKNSIVYGIGRLGAAACSWPVRLTWSKGKRTV